MLSLTDTLSCTLLISLTKTILVLESLVFPIVTSSLVVVAVLLGANATALTDAPLDELLLELGASILCALILLTLATVVASNAACSIPATIGPAITPSSLIELFHIATDPEAK